MVKKNKNALKTLKSTIKLKTTKVKIRLTRRNYK